ncbi:MAG TPA: thiamine pyrophosphate-dependent enzyme, partial [Mycobacterium sp.]
MQSGAQRPRDPGGLTGGRWSFRSAGRWFARLLASYQCWMLGGVGCTWGIPGAIGAKFANPDKTVIGFTGDGGSMYTIQALWTAA